MYYSCHSLLALSFTCSCVPLQSLIDLLRFFLMPSPPPFLHSSFYSLLFSLLPFLKPTSGSQYCGTSWVDSCILFLYWSFVLYQGLSKWYMYKLYAYIIYTEPCNVYYRWKEWGCGSGHIFIVVTGHNIAVWLCYAFQRTRNYHTGQWFGLYPCLHVC